MNRCVNIDWLEVFASEYTFDQDVRDATYYERLGYKVEQREYGTPQYREMFTIYQNGFPYIEIRRNPYSLKKHGGIFNDNDCHIRLSNRTCYFLSPIDELRHFMIAHQYEYKSLSRIDICLDFNYFDRGDNPNKVMLDYMSNRISKINQCNISAHGKDSFSQRIWNSVSWGSKNSMVSTKLYCKSLELKEVKDKFYIRDCWLTAGLRQDIPVWRVEFSIKSDMKHLLRLDTGEVIKHDLTCYDNRDKCLFRFHSLAQHYFHFKYIELMENGKPRRKDRCRDKILFRINRDEAAFKPAPPTKDTEPTRTDKLLVKRLRAIYNDMSKSNEIRYSAKNLISDFVKTMRMKEYAAIRDEIFLKH